MEECVPIASTSEIPEEGQKIIEIGGRMFTIFNNQGKYFISMGAIKCPQKPFLTDIPNCFQLKVNRKVISLNEVTFKRIIKG